MKEKAEGSSGERVVECKTLYYDGACPLCAREIAFYRNLKGASDIRWTDVSTARSAALPRPAGPRVGSARGCSSRKTSASSIR